MEACESTPSAASAAALLIRRYLMQHRNHSRPSVQYNAIMLFRILIDNPGPTFTRNVDNKFVVTIKEVLRNSKDPSVQTILRETMMTIYREKAYDTNLANLFAMWQKEMGSPTNMPPPPPSGGILIDDAAATFRPRHTKPFPPAHELASRIEEARTSAKLLQQLVQSTPQADLKTNDLIREFADRCQSAQRSIQGYLATEDSSIDDETMQTLIETSELLSLALSKHSRALLQARRAGGNSPLPPSLSGRTTPNLTPLPATMKPVPGSEPLQKAQLPLITTTPALPAAVPAPVPSSAVQHSYSPPPLPPPGHHSDDEDEEEDDPFSDTYASNVPRPQVTQLTTKSYVKRQDAAENSLSMSGAGAVSPARGAEGSVPLGDETGISPVEERRRY